MKSIIAAALLVLATPALAATATPAQWRYIRALQDAHEACVYRIDPEAVKKGCAAETRLMPKLKAQGFCFYGHGTVGKIGRLKTQKDWERTVDAPAGPVPKGARFCHIIR